MKLLSTKLVTNSRKMVIEIENCQIVRIMEVVLDLREIRYSRDTVKVKYRSQAQGYLSVI